MMLTVSRPISIRGRATALALAVLLIVSAFPGATAAQLPQAGPLPAAAAPRNEPAGENQVIVYHAATGTTEILPFPPVEGLPSAWQVPGHVDAWALLAPEDFGELGQVTNPYDWPWRGHVKLFRTFPSGETSGCSGVLLDSGHVLTAGHCVYTHDSDRCNPPDQGCWPTSIRIIPGYDNGVGPYGEAGFSNLWAWTAWTNDEDLDWDMGLIALDRPVGALTGWYGFGYNDDDSFFTGTNTFRSTGYPAVSPYDGELMYTWSGTLDWVTTHRLAHTNYVYEGQSGSGIYRDDANRVVYGTASYRSGMDDDAVYNRITGTKFSTLIDWIRIDTPDTVDLVPLDVHTLPGTLDRGDTLTTLNYLIHNYSQAAWNGTVGLGVYLSTNWEISSADRQISTRSWTGSLASKASIRVNAGAPLPTIPADLCGAWPGGTTYWIGLIANVADANSSNNDTSGYDAAPVLVTACDQYEVDDTWSQARTLVAGQAQTHDIIPAGDVDWARFTLSQVTGVRLETAGSVGDTRLWLYDDGLAELDHDDDGGAGAFSRIDTCLPAGTYYVKVDEYNQDEKIRGYSLALTTGSGTVGTCVRGYLPLVVRSRP